MDLLTEINGKMTKFIKNNYRKPNFIAVDRRRLNELRNLMAGHRHLVEKINGIEQVFGMQILVTYDDGIWVF